MDDQPSENMTHHVSDDEQAPRVLLGHERSRRPRHRGPQLWAGWNMGDPAKCNVFKTSSVIKVPEMSCKKWHQDKKARVG